MQQRISVTDKPYNICKANAQLKEILMKELNMNICHKKNTKSLNHKWHTE